MTQTRTGLKDAALVGEVSIERVPLHAGLLSFGEKRLRRFQVHLARQVGLAAARRVAHDRCQVQHRAHQLLYDSLEHFGVLGLTQGETLEQAPTADRYAEFDQENNLYRKIS